MPLQQQITKVININLLYGLSTIVLILSVLNFIQQDRIKYYYSQCINYVFTIGVLLIAISFRDVKFFFALVLFCGLFFLSLMDIFYRILPDIINFLLLIFGFSLSLENHFISAIQSSLGILVGYFIVWGISAGYENSTGQLGIGGGDLKLTAALGAWIGLEDVLSLLFWSSVLGCVFYWFMVVTGKYDRFSKIPFGLFLSIVGMSIFMMRFSVWHG